MAQFTIRLRVTHFPANYELMNVILNDDINGSISRCDVSEKDGEIVGRFTWIEDVEDTMFVYYRHNIPENFYHSIKKKKEENKNPMTIAELL